MVIIDKFGEVFSCKLRQLSQNTFDQKVANLKMKDFEISEVPYFDFLNFFFKSILFLSSLIFLIYGFFNIKRIRKSLQKTSILIYIKQRKNKIKEVYLIQL